MHARTNYVSLTFFPTTNFFKGRSAQNEEKKQGEEYIASFNFLPFSGYFSISTTPAELLERASLSS